MGGRRARAGLLAVVLAGAACAAPGSDVDEASSRIAAGDFDWVGRDGLHVVTGPDCIVEYIGREAVSGKAGLVRHLASDQKHVRYFSVLALSRIGDVESRRTLGRWVQAHGDRDRSLALLIHAQLVRRFEGLRAGDVDRFALATWLAVAHHHLRLSNAGVSAPEEDVEKPLRRIDDHLLRMLFAFPFLEF